MSLLDSDTVFTKADVCGNQGGEWGRRRKEDAVTATESCFHQSLTCTQGFLQQGSFRKYKKEMTKKSEEQLQTAKD